MSTGKIIKYRDTNFAVSTGYGTAVSITGITNAVEAVVTSTAHGLADLSVVRFAGVVGMDELNGMLFAVDVLTANTFKLIGYNTLDSAAYVSGGTVEPVIFTSACELTSTSGSSGSTPETDDSTWCDAESKFSFGLPDPGSSTFNYNYAETAVKDALETSRTAVSMIAIRIGFKNYPHKLFEIGTITQTTSGVAKDGNWEGSATLRRRFSPIRVTPTV